MMKRIYNIFIAAVFSVILSSCGFFEVEPQVIPAETYYKTTTDVFNGVTGVYGVMNNEPFYGSYYSLMCSNVDDLCYFNRSTTSNYTNVYGHDAGTMEIYAAWTEIYKGIRNANFFLAKVPQTGLDAEGRYTNEVKFLMAYYYFLLAQAWGDVPLRTQPTESYEDVACEATSQYAVLKWAADQMEECVKFYNKLYREHPEYELEDLNAAPSRVCLNTVRGVLARVYLFMAGESVIIEDADLSKADCYDKARAHAKDVIDSKKHSLNNDYSQVFKNMISGIYDRKYRESMWEVDFAGNRSSSDNWSNGRIGDLLGLQSSGSKNYAKFKCNFAYGQYNGSLKLWDLYWTEDRTSDEKSKNDTITDKRQQWNMPPYNYAGLKIKVTTKDEYGLETVTEVVKKRASIDTNYFFVISGKDTLFAKDYPTVVPDSRNCGKFRREVEYEGVMDAKRLYTSINFPILRYSDVLLMFAEADLELTKAVGADAFKCVLKVRERAGIKTKGMGDYDVETFRQLIRNERARELCFEATRKYDLIRWGIFVEQMNAYRVMTLDKRWTSSSTKEYAADMGTAVGQKHVLLPIPSIELGVNGKLKQNNLW